MKRRDAAMLAICIAAVYAICAVQPPEADDFAHYMHATQTGVLSATWELYRDWGGRIAGWWYNTALAFNPFSLVKPAMLLTAAFLCWAAWRLFGGFERWRRAGLTMLCVLGFPYMGHILPWNAAACTYGVSTVCACVALWQIETHLLRPAAERPAATPLQLGLLALSVFGSGLGSEVWLFMHGGCLLYLLWADLIRDRRPAAWRNPFFSAYFVLCAASLAIYLLGGNMARLSVETGAMPVATQGLQSGRIAHALKFMLHKSAGIGVVDMALPLLFLLLLHRSKRLRQPATRAPLGFYACGFAAMILLLAAVDYVGTVFYYRTRFIYVFFLIVAVIRTDALDRINSWLNGRWRVPKMLGGALLCLPIAFMAANVYFSCISTGTDYGRWLEYRERLARRDSALGREPLPWTPLDTRFRSRCLPSPRTLRFSLARYNAAD